ncbi:type 4 pilus major pilin [Plesiomonas sp. ZOR0011]|uniref:type 4 pilus major pilin n=1 Tax=Plesiomonas sp. ZOR0011 TaxID=1339230 RepID=UPI000646D1ED|nr:type 4 pilus major pilin [Plesiomonas sp. ZOR0011]
MELLNSTNRSPINRGSITLLEAGVYIGISLLIYAIAMTAGGGLFNRNDSSTEISNAADILYNTSSMLKSEGTYPFSGPDDMTGALAQFGGVPKNMTIIGKKESGSAKVQSLYGGAVTVQPVATSGGQKTWFSLTYASVPQEACIAIGTKVSASPRVASTQINGTTTNGPIAASSIGAMCNADKGTVGQNTLTFVSNS